jgi:hypothetical protein
MTWDNRRIRRRLAAPLTVEPLEGRLLLSMYQGPTRSRPVYSNGAYYRVTLTGPGYLTVSQVGSGHHQQFAINLFGTTTASDLSVSLMLARKGFANNHSTLQIGQLNVSSGQLGGVEALGAADLVGPVSPLNGSVSTLQFNSIGGNAQIDVPGSLGSLSTSGAITLSPTAEIHLGGLTGPVSLGGLTIDGGQFLIDGDLTGPFNPGDVTIEQGGRLSVGGDITGAVGLGALTLDGGQFLVSQGVAGNFAASGMTLQNGGLLSIGQDLGGGLSDTGNLTVDSHSAVVVGHNLTGLDVTQGLTLDGGLLVVGNDLNGPMQVGSDLSISNSGQFVVGRDLSGGATIMGNLAFDSGGLFTVGRDLNGLSTGGNIQFTPSAGASTITVGGGLTNLVVSGFFQGKGTSTIDLNVGTNLNNFTVTHGGANLGSVRNANINVDKSIVGLNIAHGIFNSLITAGVSIDGTTAQSSSAGGNIGPDGADAVFDSQILAGVQIVNLTIGGNVHSDYVTNPNPTGYPTRIIAGAERGGNFTSGGSIDNFQITGELIDAVLAASVAPNGGNGTLPTSAYGAPPPTFTNTPGDGGHNTYDAPAGVTVGGTTSDPIKYQNYSNLSYYNQTFTGVTYNTAIDPTIDDTILPGSINASFATTPANLSDANIPTTVTIVNGNTTTTTTTTTPVQLSLPSKSTVLGGVISTPHGSNPDAYDFAGIFAADTRGVFVGPLPQPS